MRRRVEGLHITARVDNRGELLLSLEEKSISITVKPRCPWHGSLQTRLGTHRSSITSKGGNASNTPPRSISSLLKELLVKSSTG